MTASFKYENKLLTFGDCSVTSALEEPSEPEVPMKLISSFPAEGPSERKLHTLHQLTDGTPLNSTLQ